MLTSNSNPKKFNCVPIRGAASRVGTKWPRKVANPTAMAAADPALLNKEVVPVEEKSPDTPEAVAQTRERAPKSGSIPATTQTSIIGPVAGTCPAMVAGTIKIPDPIMTPMWMAMPSRRPRARRSWGLEGSNQREVREWEMV